MFHKSSGGASDLSLALEAAQPLCSWTGITENWLGPWWLCARQVSYTCGTSILPTDDWGLAILINNKQEKYNAWFSYGFFFAFPPLSHLIFLYL